MDNFWKKGKMEKEKCLGEKLRENQKILKMEKHRGKLGKKLSIISEKLSNISEKLTTPSGKAIYYGSY